MNVPNPASPSALYAAQRATESITGDPGQRIVLEQLDALHEAVLANRRLSLRQRLSLTRDRHPHNGNRGLYLWGGVGRGKTFLMDLFHDSIPFEEKRRVHFHRFMLELHDHLHQLRLQSDPMTAVVDRLVGDCRVLSLDEFFVSDIGDAMMLSSVLQELFVRGTVLVTTSNIAPDELYRRGLQRQRFLPAIALIHSHMTVLELPGTLDHRRQTMQQAPVYFTPDDQHANDALYSQFVRVSRGSPCSAGPIEINGRPIASRGHGEGVGWFDFNALCEGHRSKADYVILSKRFHTLLITGIPVLGADEDDATRRLIELIDELYDRRVNVIVSAAAPAESLYQGKRLQLEFQRLISRMHEFASWDYIALTHRP